MIPLPVAMIQDELRLFCQFLQCTKAYLEFGAGGSTCLAAQKVTGHITSVDSSREWLDRVKGVCVSNRWNVPDLLHVDIGEVRTLGYPRDETSIARWPRYHEDVWRKPESRQADFYLVDGRFRVACALQILLRCEEIRPFAIHDYAGRPQYHVVSNFADEIARAGELSIFIRKSPFDRFEAERALEQFSLIPD
jgi:hypothetical protein